MSTEPRLYNVHKLEKIALPTEDGCVFMEMATINYCEADGNYTTVHFLDKTRIVVINTLMEVLSLLPKETFFKIHDKHGVNLNQCKKFDKVTSKVEMENGEKLKVARRRIAEFKEIYMNPNLGKD